MKIVDTIPQVELVVNKEGEREENYSAIPLNLDVPLIGLDKFDGILINMISGNDLSLTQLKELRKNYNGLIYFDVHTFSRGVDKYLRRFFRRIKGFIEWAKCIDIVQANEIELKTLSDQTSELKIVEELFTFGIQQVIITRSERGATVFTSERNKKNEFHKDAFKVKSIYKVGCGDIFGAVYFYNYIKNKNIPSALECANHFAGIATTYSDVKSLLNLKKDVH
jgi:sugar/nucleoside kinase (ribokinase family)